MNNEELYDLIIIGAAAVGTAASVYASRRHLHFKIVSKDIGGEVALSGEVENWPGIIKTTGIELSAQFHEHMKYYNVPIDDGHEVTSITKDGNVHVVTAKSSTGEEKIYRTKSVIIGSGVHPRNLKVPGEEERRGKGITYCTTCDGPLFGGKTTATIGAGNSAVESALMMAGIAKKVYVITRYSDDEENKGGFPPAEEILVKKLKELDNVEIIYNADTKEILGDGMVSGIKYLDTASNEEKELDVQGVMVHIGVIPNSTFVDCVDKDPAGQIVIDKLCKTSRDGIFAAGDVTDIPYNQIAIAAGHGVTAALSAIDYINKWEA
ncbi:MAG: FAD-dependent oxidoreductase [Candidatus Magasanikbacteria bacterium]